MARRFLRGLPVAALLLLVLALPAAAISSPPVTGTISGVELCPKSICGVAIFAGQFSGRVSNRRAFGNFYAQVSYDSLPGTITGGFWSLSTNRGSFVGDVEDGGQLTANGDNTFEVTGTLDITFGGAGTLSFDGTLDHNTFPPTITGTLSQ